MIDYLKAYELLKKRLPGYKALDGCIELDDIFIFNMVPMSTTEEEYNDPDRIYDNHYAVNRKTKNIEDYSFWGNLKDIEARGKSIKFDKSFREAV